MALDQRILQQLEDFCRAALSAQRVDRRFLEIMGFVDDNGIPIRKDSRSSIAQLQVGKKERMVANDNARALGLLVGAFDKAHVEEVARDTHARTRS